MATVARGTGVGMGSLTEAGIVSREVRSDRIYAVGGATSLDRKVRSDRIYAV